MLRNNNLIRYKRNFLSKWKTYGESRDYSKAGSRYSL